MLTVVDAFPCAAESSELVEVEIDPASMEQARERIEARGLVPVGWYHSHPTFEPRPSHRDAQTQALFQKLFRRSATRRAKREDAADAASRDAAAQDSEGGEQTPDSSDADDDRVEPFVALIVAPYDVRLPRGVSVFTWFHADAGGHPMRLDVVYAPSRELCAADTASAWIDAQLELLAAIRTQGDRSSALALDEVFRTVPLPDAGASALHALANAGAASASLAVPGAAGASVSGVSQWSAAASGGGAMGVGGSGGGGRFLTFADALEVSLSEHAVMCGHSASAAVTAPLVARLRAKLAGGRAAALTTASSEARAAPPPQPFGLDALAAAAAMAAAAETLGSVSARGVGGAP